MTEARPTYDLAAAQIKAYVQPLRQGAPALGFDVRDEQGRVLRSNDDHLCGKHQVLVFLNQPEAAAALPVLRALAAVRERLAGLEIAVIAFSASSDAAHNRQLKRDSGFDWPLPGDSTGGIFASFGVHKLHDTPCRLVHLTPLRQVRNWYDGTDNLDEKLGEIMRNVEAAQAAREAHWSPPHAPVLIVPNVLTPKECGQLIESVETGGPLTVRPPQPGEIDGDYKIPVYEHNRQDRVDHIIKAQATLAFLDERLWGRIAPLVKQAFAFDVTRREDLHIARYEGKRGGNQMGHRDNVGPTTAYRRFALSMNLNEDFEGGELVFREYSPRGYRCPAGSAMIFSSSLLHEVLETTSGVRYNLISHLFNEQALPR